ncbi:MAG: archaeosortase/exosortase family protein [Candidatus Bathyarchaeia archaeon]|nr:archaeosortase/exosortase family protein [Candidatus Bathyarchaeota archaeon]
MRTLKNRLSGVIRTSNLVKILFILSLTASVLISYLLNPESFERTWKGRVYYIFFLWLTSLKLILKWGKIYVKITKLKSTRFIIFCIASLLPIIYALAANFSGLNSIIVELSPKHYGDDWWAKTMPTTIEYIVFTVLFSLINVVAYGIRGLRVFLLPIALLGTVGSIFLIDNLYPHGEFTPFQIFVPTTAAFAARILDLMGYQVEVKGQTYKTPVLRVRSSEGEASFGIAWPCSGIDSLIIYSAVTILFLEDEAVSWKRKAAYFLIGALVAYFINVLRIAEIFILAVKYGVTSLEVQRFHDYYGPLYSLTWIIFYQLIIIGVQSLQKKISSKATTKDL